jgi:N-carbamoyl-D-amino-acid hydrolase
MRLINIAAAQMGPIQKADSRETVITRMIALMDEARARGADLIVYPELALTTFFPRWFGGPHGNAHPQDRTGTGGANVERMGTG